MLLFGYAVTIVLAGMLISLLYSVVKSTDLIANTLKKRINKQSLAALALIAIFFVSFSILYVHPVEELYFDENIYQGIALNILHNGNAVWCQYSSGYAINCPNSQIYHDPAGISFFLAIAFALFGAGIDTAYNMELAIGLLSIISMFFLASMVFRDKKAVVASTLAFALLPELFIWSRTQAVPNLIFMFFTILAFFFFLIFREKRNAYTLLAFLSSLAITMYMRLEGVLLVAIFGFLYLFMSGGNNNLGLLKKAKDIIKKFDHEMGFMLALLIFLLAMAPEAYFISYQLANPQFGQSSSGLFSLSTFNASVLGVNGYGTCTLFGHAFGPNICYFAGAFNTVGFYPVIFPQATTALALVGLLLLIIYSIYKKSEMYNLLLIATSWILVYHIFYDFFYAGAVTYGVDVRFMLEIMPPIALLAGVCISEAGNIFGLLPKTIPMVKWKLEMPKLALSYLTYAVIILALLILPFIASFSELSIAPSQQPQQTVILNAMSFFYSNYSKVPANCLVFSYTPDMWLEQNISSAQIGMLSSSDSNFTAFARNFKCFVMDVGYWCNVPPEISSKCSGYTTNYHIKPLVVQNYTQDGQNYSFGYYQMLNYNN